MISAWLWAIVWTVLGVALALSIPNLERKLVVQTSSQLKLRSPFIRQGLYSQMSAGKYHPIPSFSLADPSLSGETLLPDLETDSRPLVVVLEPCPDKLAQLTETLSSDFRLIVSRTSTQAELAIKQQSAEFFVVCAQELAVEPHLNDVPLSSTDEAWQDETERFQQQLQQQTEELLSRHQLTVENLAQNMVMSVRSLQRKTQKYYGVSCSEYIKSIQFMIAQKQLEQGASVKQAAINAGFLCPNHFSRQFKRHFGFTPSQFRAQQT
ncbi:helix-turn-helix transcriptional regulator [Vibrio navarrensis]|uniref:helix-turn-helix transcriptional regulator n=1 Tax=Vibrio navarrensis TaxID=29495 RepID=UPI00186A30EB|nr:helix-turn-helix transcriptional regulator [Vibrio navarrensis]